MSYESNARVIAEALFSLTVMFATLAPRPDPKDKSFFGGELSRPFRQAMVLVTFTLIVRNLVLPKRLSPADCQPNETLCGIRIAMWYIVGAIGSILLGFLNLCMPYLIQRRLSQVINIVPGKNLTVWLVFIMFITFSAVALSATVSPRLWALKRIGDALFGVPAIQTIRLYDRILGAQEKSRTLIQTLLVLEYAHLVSANGAGLFYAYGMRKTGIGFGMRLSWTFLRWMMLLMQALLLNLMDESQYHSCQASEETTTDNSDTEVAVVEESDNTALISRKI